MPDNNDRIPVDAFVEIVIENDKHTAYIVLHQPKFGGKFLSPEQIRDEIECSEVVFGLEDMDRILSAVKAIGYERRIPIAEWKPPINGENGFIQYHYSSDKVAKPTEDEHGNVDFKDLGIITNILRGTKIATVFEPTEGEEGFDVLGNSIPQTPGTPALVKLGLGTELTPDGRYIVASVDGNLVFKNGSFIVDKELRIAGDVGVSTGNIDFIGDVIIGGSVSEGFKVTTKKNVSIRGSVTAAEINAGGNVSVSTGCFNSAIRCKGDFTGSFCENTRIEAGGKVEAISFIACEVFSHDRIIAKGKSIISGGKYTALVNVESANIGSDRYVKTEITVGNNAVLTGERATAVVRLEKLQGAVEQLTKVIDMLAEKQKQGKTLSPRHEQLRSESVRTRILTQKEIKKILDRIDEIDNELAHKQQISIVCKGRLYPGTTLHIDAYTYAVTEVYDNSKATVLDDKIVILRA